MGGATQIGSMFTGLSNAGFVGGKMNPNTIAAVKDSAGELTAYDPARMAPTTAPKDPLGPALGLAGTGIAQGATGITGTGAGAPVVKNALYKPPAPVMARGEGAYRGQQTPAPVAPTAAPQTAAPAAPTLQYVPAIPQQYQVNDQWNSRTGTSQQVASLPRGGVDSGFGMGQAYWLDPKTGMHYADPSGKHQIDQMTAGLNPITGRPNY